MAANWIGSRLWVEHAILKKI